MAVDRDEGGESQVQRLSRMFFSGEDARARLERLKRDAINRHCPLLQKIAKPIVREVEGRGWQIQTEDGKPLSGMYATQAEPQAFLDRLERVIRKVDEERRLKRGGSPDGSGQG